MFFAYLRLALAATISLASSPQLTIDSYCEEMLEAASPLLRPTIQDNEYVQVGTFEETWPMLLKAELNDEVLLRSPVIGRYQGDADPDHARIQVVEFGKDRHFVQQFFLKVPKKTLVRLPFGSTAVALKAIGVVENIPLEFSRGEKVRLRNPNGGSRIVTGEFIGITTKQGFEIRLGEKIVVAGRNSVFKIAGNIEPNSIRYKLDWLEDTQGNSPLEIAFYNAGGKLTSHDEFLRADNRKKLLLLVKFLRTTLAPSLIATHADRDGLLSLHRILEAGIGVCRHSAYGAVRILSEAGYFARLGVRLNKEGSGHAWAEVDLPTPSGGIMTFVVDPINGFVASRDEIASRSIPEPAPGWFSDWYLHPERDYPAPFVQPKRN
jgi:hypothetical protein